MPDDIKLPPRPEPDGFLTIRIIGRDVEVNAYRDSTMDEYARAAVEADRLRIERQIDWLVELLHRAQGYVKDASYIYYDGTDGAAIRQSAALLSKQIDAAIEAAHGIPAPKGGA